MSLVVIGASTSIARVAQSLSGDVVFVQRPGSLDPRVLRDNVDGLVTLDFTDHSTLAPLAERVLRAYRPEAVVSVTELGMEPAAILSELLGTPGTPLPVVRATRDKLAMRRRLADRAPHLNPDFADPRDAAATGRLFAAHPEVVAKPRTGTASEGVRRLRSAAEVPAGADLLLEAYVPGPEFSVEAFSRAGVHDVLAVAEKGTGDNFVEVSHVVPPAGLDAAGLALVGRAVTELLDALGLRDGPSHTEVKAHDGAVTVIETHNRPGGDGIADLVAATTGVDWRRVSVGWPLGVTPERGTPAAPAAAVVFFTAPPGTVTAVADRPEPPAGVRIAHWDVTVGIGDRVGELRGSADRLGSAGVTGPSAAACLEFVRTVQGTVVGTGDRPR